jgi:hypothetical protein
MTKRKENNNDLHNTRLDPGGKNNDLHNTRLDPGGKNNDLHNTRLDPGGKTKDYNIGICCFPVKYVALRRKSKDWLARNHDNVSE